jgi:hypothetical protein
MICRIFLFMGIAKIFKNAHNFCGTLSFCKNVPQNATLTTERIFGSTFITLKKFDYVRTKLWANLLSEESKRKKPNYPPIYVRITVDGISKECSTKRQCDVIRWNQKIPRI